MAALKKVISRGPTPCLVGIDVPPFQQQLQGRDKDAAEFLKVFKEFSQKDEPQHLTIAAAEGSGKTSFIAHVFSQRPNLEFMANECRFHLALWVNCSKFRDSKFDERKFTAELAGLARRAASDQSCPFPELQSILQYFNKQKKRRILFILDNISVEDAKLLSFMKTAFCLILTEKPSNMNFNLPVLPDSIITNLLPTDLKTKLGQAKFADLLKLCKGSPLAAILLKGFFSLESQDSQLRSSTEKFLKAEKFNVELLVQNIIDKLNENQIGLICPFLFYENEEPLPTQDLTILLGLQNAQQAADSLKVLEKLGFVKRLDAAFREIGDRYVLHGSVRDLTLKHQKMNNYLQNQSNLSEAGVLLALQLGFKVQLADDRLMLKFMQKVISQQRAELWEKIVRNFNLAKFIYEKFPDLASLKDPSQMTALHLAAKNGSFESVKFLFDLHPEAIHLPDKKLGQLPLLWAVANDAPLEVVKFLTKNFPTALSSKNTFFRQTALSLAAEYARQETVEFLCEKNPEALLLEDVTGRLPLCAAAEVGRLPLVTYLLAKRPEASQSGLALIHAAQNGHFEVVRFLLEKCPELEESKDSEGFTAKDRAAANGHGDVVELFVNSK